MISFEPLQAIRGRVGRFQAASRAVRGLVRRDLAELRSRRSRLVRDGLDDLSGLMAAIAGDLHRVGCRGRPRARPQLAAGASRGRRAARPGAPTLAALRAERRRGGYLR